MSETLTEVGEFGLIERIQRLLQREGIQARGVTLGIGDDTASFEPHAEHDLLVTCDCMVEGRHYLPEFITPLDLGRRAMIMNISDIGAMGGTPLYALVSLGLRPNTRVTEVEAMYRGFMAELNPFGAAVIGGNVTGASGANFVDITLIGEIERGCQVRRSTAQVGDAILVTGYPGQSAAGLQLLRHAQAPPSLMQHPLVRAYNTPSHRAWEGRAAARSGHTTAMIDTSDGFLGDLGHLCQESGVGARLVQAQFPLSEMLRHVASELETDPYALFLGDSDDYELLITCAPENVDAIRATMRAVNGVPVTVVGNVTEARGIQIVAPDSTHRPLHPTGWDHFGAGR